MRSGWKMSALLIGCLLLYGCGNEQQAVPAEDLPSTQAETIPPIAPSGTLEVSPAHEIRDVPLLAQMPELPTGCEVTSLAMLLQYEGVAVEKEDVAKHLPRVEVPSYEEEGMVGGDPNDGFVGDPFSDEGYGVYHAPIAALLNDYMPGRAEDLSGQDFEAVLRAVGENRPVVIWISMDLADVTTAYEWQVPSGGEIQWNVPEHCVLLIGYDEQTVTVHDPYSGAQVQYDRDRFVQVWQAMGAQAVTVAHV